MQKTIERNKDNNFDGYCELQGLYLAARDYGQLDAFEQFRKEECKNKIPNF